MEQRGIEPLTSALLKHPTWLMKGAALILGVPPRQSSRFYWSVMRLIIFIAARNAATVISSKTLPTGAAR
jgi:hypothetical protein